MLSTPPRANPINNIKSDDDEVWIDGRLFKVTRLPSQQAIKNQKVSKALLDFANRIGRLSDERAKEVVEKSLRRDLVMALRDKLDGIRLTKAIKEDYEQELMVTDEMIEARLLMLRSMQTKL